MTSPKDVVEQYVYAFARKDVKKMRSFLSDTNFSFKGPLQAFATAADFAAALAPLVPIIQSVDVQKAIADGNDVCMFYDLATTVFHRDDQDCRTVPGRKRQDSFNQPVL